MNIENDPNVIYGGDAEDFGPLNGNCISLGQLILKNLKEGGSKTSLVNGTLNQYWTFQDLYGHTVAAARTLKGAGIRENDVVSIISENRHEFAAIAFGTIVLNAIVAPINVTYTERELQHALDLSKPKLVFVSPAVARKTVNVCRKLNYVKNVVLIDGSDIDNFILSLSGMLKKYQQIEFDVNKFAGKEVDIHDQVALIFCSSGTTGLPKGVLITQENAMSCLQTYRGYISYVERLNKLSLITLNIAPFFHVLGFISMFMYANSPTTKFVFLKKFEEANFYKAIEILRPLQRYKVNFLIVVPPIMVLLAKSALFDKYDLSSVKDMSSGAAALSKEVEEQVRQRFGGKINVRQGYGLSEVTYGVTGAVEILKPGSVGQPYKGVYAKVIDENGKSLGPHKSGELCFKGPRIMKGYINDPKATSETIDKDGWLHTGDVGYYDEDKQFFIVDRLKELIKYKAFQVPPAELEGLLLSNPKVKDCGVIGVPDEESGELPFAFVVKQPNADLTEKEVKDFVARNASSPKWLRGGVKFIKEIPKNPSGKILRRELRNFFKSSKAKL